MQRPILRTAFIVVVLGVFGGTVLWSVRQNEAYQREAEAMGRSPESLSPPMSAEAVAPPPPRLISVVNSSGRPVAGVNIYASDLTERIATSDARGQISIVPSYGGLAWAPDGRVLWLQGEQAKIVFGARTTIRLRLTDGHGVPSVGRKITIVPQDLMPGFDPMGLVVPVPKMAPELMSRFTRTTDGGGSVLFSGLAKHQAFRVFVHLDSAKALTFDQLVISGSRRELVVGRDRRIEGRVTRASGSPLAGMKVELAVTNDGRFPTLTQRWTTTDRDGRYQFDNLLTCGYSIRLDSPAKPLGQEGVVDVRRGTGPWISRPYHGPPPPGDWNAMEYLRLWPEKSVTVCDFRWTEMAYADVQLTLATPALSLQRITVRDIKNGWAEGSAETDHAHFKLRPGTYEIYMETKRRTEDRAVTGFLGKVTLSEGERKTLRFTAGR